jgi:DNA-directed RNA polymerase specialized sigma24 family protein
VDESDLCKLLRDVAADSPEATEKFYWAFRPSLIYWLRNHYVPNEDVEDLLQETFTKAFLAIKRGQYRHISTAALLGWLRTIASRLLVELRRNQEPTVSQWATGEEGERDRFAEIPSGETSCDQTVALKEAFAVIEGALDDFLINDEKSEQARDIGLLKKVAFLSFYVDNLCPGSA